jgi:uncharacterized membrane protein YGL010W
MYFKLLITYLFAQSAVNGNHNDENCSIFLIFIVLSKNCSCQRSMIAGTRAGIVMTGTHLVEIINSIFYIRST